MVLHVVFAIKEISEGFKGLFSGSIGLSKDVQKAEKRFDFLNAGFALSTID